MLNGEPLSAGDGVGIEGAGTAELAGVAQESEVVLFDFAM